MSTESTARNARRLLWALMFGILLLNLLLFLATLKRDRTAASPPAATVTNATTNAAPR